MLYTLLGILQTVTPAVVLPTDWTGIATLVTALAAAIVSIYTALKTNSNTVTLAKADVVQEEIHKAVNSNMAAAVAEIKDGKETIAALTEKAAVQFETQMGALRAQIVEQERVRAALESATQAAAALAAQQRYEKDDPRPRRK